MAFLPIFVVYYWARDILSVKIKRDALLAEKPCSKEKQNGKGLKVDSI